MRCKFIEKDLESRLHGTVCRYDGKPYYLQYEGGRQFSLTTLSARKRVHVINADDIHLDISTPYLGFCQITPDYVSYVTRKPARMWKQGVSQDNIIWNYLSIAAREAIKPGILTSNFEDMILQKYPDLDAALKIVSSDDTINREIAISNDIALKYNGRLQLIYVYFKQDQVGFLQKGSKKVIVASNERGWIISKYLQGYSWDVE